MHKLQHLLEWAEEFFYPTDTCEEPDEWYYCFVGEYLKDNPNLALQLIDRYGEGDYAPYYQDKSHWRAVDAYFEVNTQPLFDSTYWKGDNTYGGLINRIRKCLENT